MSNPPDTFTGSVTLKSETWDLIEDWSAACDLSRDQLVAAAVHYLINDCRGGLDADDAARLAEWKRERV